MRSVLEHLLSCWFSQGVSFEWPELRAFLADPAFPGREAAFKRELAEAILEHRISPAEFERLTAVDQDSQEDVDRFLREEVWEPLYPGEDVRVS